MPRISGCSFSNLSYTRTLYRNQKFQKCYPRRCNLMPWMIMGKTCSSTYNRYSPIACGNRCMNFLFSLRIPLLFHPRRCSPKPSHLRRHRYLLSLCKELHNALMLSYFQTVLLRLRLLLETFLQLVFSRSHPVCLPLWCCNVFSGMPLGVRYQNFYPIMYWCFCTKQTQWVFGQIPTIGDPLRMRLCLLNMLEWSISQTGKWTIEERAFDYFSWCSV